MKHNNERPHKCDIHGCFFKRKGGLSLHNRQVHIEEKNIPCSECETKFTNITSMKLHMRIHIWGKRYKYNNCEGKFPFKNNLTQHLKK